MNVAHPDAAVPATLQTPLLYAAFAPASDVLDAFTLLSPAQDLATFALCAAVFFVPGMIRDLRRPGRFRPLGTLGSILRFIGGTVAVVGLMAVATRPMASLRLKNPDLIAVDFHSHTQASHDGRPGFDSEKNRAWHQRSGFDAVYITDHATFAGALDGSERNPARAGGGTTVLPGVELSDDGEHPILIGADPRRMRITSNDWSGAAVKADTGPIPPILLLSIPGNISRVPPNELSGPIRLAGIEASDGSPRGIAQTARDRKGILALAGKLHLALVAGSDNHGWGRTAPAWSVLRVAGWRDMTPASLDAAIRRALIAREPGTVDVIARRTVGPASGKMTSALAGVSVGLLMLRTMNPGERLSWIAWSWAGAFVSLVLVRRKRRRLRLRVREIIGERSTRPPLLDAAAAVRASS